MSTLLSQQTQTDAQQRQQALDPQQSFIIQAPAGSGKTELLIQRYLRLLATVDDSQKILAITFTKKAAGEMRLRIHKALKRAQDANPPEKPHERNTWQLARQVYAHGRQHHWDMDHMTNRLSIMTIDASCQQFLRLCQSPYNLHAHFALCLQPQLLYRDTVERFIHRYCLGTGGRHQADFAALLFHQHHDYAQVERLLIAALQNREQWIDLAFENKYQDFARIFMNSINKLQSTHITKLCHGLSAQQSTSLQALLTQLHSFHQALGIHSWPDACQLPPTQWQLNDWLRISGILLTNDGLVRSRFTKTQGFASSAQIKTLAVDEQTNYQALKSALLDWCHAAPAPWRSLLSSIRDLPTVLDAGLEWAPLQPLFALLPSLTAFLQLQMQAQQCIDFAGLNLQLRAALYDEQQRHALTMAIYQNYQHVLIDEFQDTSVSQFAILESAFASWSGENQRTITVVGDPMQSIYRFRQAEVKLFYQVQQQGFAGIHMTNLALSSNYRSCFRLIETLNACFSRYMNPAHNRFHPAQAIFDTGHGGLYLHRCAHAKAQYHALAQTIVQQQRQTPQASFCLLVRSRTQLAMLLPILQAHRIVYHGTGIQSLATCQAVLDVATLLRLPLDFFDREAWLALLRAPAINFNISDLMKLCQHPNKTIWDQLCHPPADLSASGQQVLCRIMPHLHNYINRYARCQHSQLARATWHALGYDLAITHTDDYLLCENFFTEISTLEHQSTQINAASIAQLLAAYPDITAESASTGPVLQVMTIHKSKGLEFDFVYLPHLEQASPLSTKALLDWTYVQAEANFHLVMHTHPRHRKQTTSVHHYLRHADKDAQVAESERLLYVAMTRAKQQCHLFYVEKKSYSERSPMQTLLPIFADVLAPTQMHRHEQNDPDSLTEQPSLVRQVLDPAWKHPLARTFSRSHELKTPPAPLPLQRMPGHVDESAWGTLVHRLLEFSLQPSCPHLSWEKCQQLAESIGIDQQYHASLSSIHTQLLQTFKGKRWQWLTQQKRQATFLETTLYAHAQAYRLDFAFWDEDNTLWVIDFKTHEINDFLVNKKATEPCKIPASYREQCLRYRQVLQELHPEAQVRCGLYYPLSDTWITIELHRHPE